MPTRPLWTSWLLRLLTTALLLAGTTFACAEEDFLDPEVAFRLSARVVDERTVEVTYTIAPGYYLYKEQLKFSAQGATLAAPVLPVAKSKFDETFQKTVETYRDVLRIAIPVTQAGANFRLLVTNQGCADRGLCYPPQERGIQVRLSAFGGDGSALVMNGNVDAPAVPGTLTGSVAAPTPAATPGPVPTDDAGIDGALRSGKFWTIVGVFFIAGVLLSLTPCVLPMLPILSSIIVGHGARVTRARGVGLAASYSLGMALVYTALGIGAGLAGEGLAAALQKPWVLVLFATGLVGLSLSMFGAYDLQMPSALTGRLSDASERLPAGRLAGVFAMGGVSALIMSPCVVAPLAGALVYLSQTRDVWLGGTALFSLSAGMSMPLLVIGASAGALLPRAGAWMDEVKHFFGFLLLGVALWTLQSVLPAPLVLAAWGTLAIALAAMLASSSRGQGQGWTASIWRRAGAAVLGACGLLQLVGAASGGTDPLQPLAPLAGSGRGAASARQGPNFEAVHTVGELDAALHRAGRPVMLDFYADWCVSCKEMEHYTFIDPAVRSKLKGALLLRADVTANNADDRALLKRFNLFGPPGTIFFDGQGREIVGAHVAGYQDSAHFLQTLQRVGL